MDKEENKNNNPELGISFTNKPLYSLRFSSKSKITGEKDSEEIEPILMSESRSQIFIRDKFCCIYCGFQSATNHIHNLDDNHELNQPENLGVVDPLCHYWQHLEVMEGKAVIAYLPGLSGQDINHLQRAISLVLKTGSEQKIKEAKEIMEWLSSHSVYSHSAFGSSSPKDFAEAISSLSFLHKENKLFVLTDLALVFTDYSLFDACMDSWIQALRHPVSEWENTYYNLLFAEK